MSKPVTPDQNLSRNEYSVGIKKNSVDVQANYDDRSIVEMELLGLKN